MGERGEVVSKQQFSNEFQDGFPACEETPNIEQTAVYSEAGVDAVWQVLCRKEHDVEEDGEQCGGQDTSLLDAVGDGETAPTVTHCANPDLADLHGAGGGWL